MSDSGPLQQVGYRSTVQELSFMPQERESQPQGHPPSYQAGECSLKQQAVYIQAAQLTFKGHLLIKKCVDPSFLSSEHDQHKPTAA